MNQFFSYTICHYCCCCNCLVSYFIALSSKILFLALIFAFCTSNSQLNPVTVGRGRRKLGSTWFGQSRWGTLNWELPFLNHDISREGKKNPTLFPISNEGFRFLYSLSAAQVLCHSNDCTEVPSTCLHFHSTSPGITLLCCFCLSLCCALSSSR